MWRTKVRVSILAVVAALAVPLVLQTSSAQAATKPNVVMIMVDDMAVSYLPVMPNVRKLIADKGTTFKNTFASYPLCCPSRATYLTGQYPHNHDVLDNKAPHGGFAKLRGKNTLPVWMSKAGYHTAHIGKYLNGYGSKNPRTVPAGWQEWHGLVSAYRMWGYSINHNGKKPKRYGTWDSNDPKLYQTDVLRKLAVDYIDRKAPGKPFFLSVAPLAPHVEVGDTIRDKYGPGSPRPAPRHKGAFKNKKLPQPASYSEGDVSDKPRHIRKLDKLGKKETARITARWRAQLESLLAVDEMVAAMVKKLAARGELDSTTIMFTGDNGYLSGQHRIREGKVHPYDASTRIPLIIRGPGFPKGRTVQMATSNVDWAPTITDVGNAKAGLQMDGRSLLSLAKNPKSGDRRQLLFETGPKGKQRWYAAIRGSRYMYIKHSTGEAELYDLKKDPQQLRSRHKDAAYKDVRARLAKRLKELHGCKGKACWGLPARPQDEPPPKDEKPGKDEPSGDTPKSGDDDVDNPGGNGGGKGEGKGEGKESASGLNEKSLPVTGLAIGGLLVLGLGSVGAGLALRAVRRRRTTG